MWGNCNTRQCCKKCFDVNLKKLNVRVFAWFQVQKHAEALPSWRARNHWRFCRRPIGVGTEIYILLEELCGYWNFVAISWCSWVQAMSITWFARTNKSLKIDYVKLVVSYAKPHIEAEAWECAAKHAQALLKQWLYLRATVEFLNVHSPTRFAGAPDVLKVMTCLPVSLCVYVFWAIGIDVIFNRPFIENDHDRLIYRVAPMPMDATLPVRFPKAKFLAETNTFGVVSYWLVSGFAWSQRFCFRSVGTN